MFAVFTCNQLVWDAFKEVRRPQLPLVRDMISAVLHPVNFAMPELNGREALDKARSLRWSCESDACQLYTCTSIVRLLYTFQAHHVLMSLGRPQCFVPCWGYLPHDSPNVVRQLSQDKPARGSCLVDAFNSILDFGSANKPNVLRALVGGLTTLWRQSPGVTGCERRGARHS